MAPGDGEEDEGDVQRVRSDVISWQNDAFILTHTKSFPTSMVTLDMEKLIKLVKNKQVPGVTP